MLLLFTGNVRPYIYGQWRTPLASEYPSDTPPVIESNESYVQKSEDNKRFLPTPKAVVRDVTYDMKTGKYLVTEKVNGVNVKPPMYLTYEEYMSLTEKEEYKNFVTARTSKADKSDIKNGAKSPIGSFNIPTQGMLFGEGGIDIKLQGNLDFQAGYSHNTIKNPALSPFQQSQGLIDMDMAMNIGLTGKIGDKFQQTLRYNNQAGFGFEGQQIKLAYTGKEDEIIRNVEAGNVSFDIPTQLIQSSQALWGIKTELQFGKLNVKTVLSQQRSNRQSKTIENGSEIQTFEITGDLYDQNRHFFLAQAFRDNYENALKDYPVINSPYQITNVEVWVSNRNIQTTSVRDVAAFQDLGECKPFSTVLSPNPALCITPDNESNSLYGGIKLDNNVRNGNSAMAALQGMGLVAYKDFEKGFLRKLNPSEYTLNDKLGYISLNSMLQSNDILAVSFQYSYRGQIHQVGDLTRDVTLPDSTSNEPSRLIYLKLLKGSNVNPSFPSWDLMMKNVYSLNAFGISQENFRLDIFYNDPGGGMKRYLPKGNLQNEPLIRTMNMDKLNINSEPFPDGIFDYVPNLTILPSNGKIYFTVLEPFGSHLKTKLDQAGNSNLTSEYVFQALYDSTQFVAQQYPELNRYTIKGSFQSSTNKRIPLGLNTPQGSVYVTMNGQRLTEGTDYIVEYGSLGYIELMDHIMTSGGKINIEYENNSTFGLQTKNFTGARLEYRFNDNFKIGSTYEKLGERPFNNKITYGEDPIKNQIIGGDISFSSNVPLITKLIDKLPFYKTNEMSSITAYGEYAKLIPGHFPTIGDAGTVYIDDFEGASINYNFGGQSTLWRLSSAPTGAKNENGETLFPESTRINDHTYGYNRAKLSWYNIATAFYFSNGFAPSNITGNKKIIDDIYMRQYKIKDIFPSKNTSNVTDLQTTLDLAFYPKERGPYNYESSSGPTAGVSWGINSDGTLKRPETRWGGIQRMIENTNFETNNIEFIQFWMLDPFIKNTNNSGDLYFNLGYVSEDVLKDSRMSFEQGLESKSGQNSNLLSKSIWSWVPKTQPLINAFSNDNSTRPFQDIGLDGANDQEERDTLKDFLARAKQSLSPTAYSILESDPSSDNFHHYLEDPKNGAGKNIIGLYKDFNGVQNNSPIIGSTETPLSNYTTPDNEDINRDNTLNENEAYFQYRVKLFPGMDVSNHPYIISKTVSTGISDPNTGDNPVWLQFRIPIKEYQHRVGQIGDFRNIQFIRMFTTNFQDSAIMRMTEMNFVRNQWRKYTGSIQTPTDYLPKDNSELSFFDVGAVGLEENSKKEPVNYLTPPGIVREVGLNATSNPIQLNEQSLRLSFCNLKDGDAKACFKNMSFDFRQYKSLKMFFHAEKNASSSNEMRDNDVSAFLRLGSDFKDNYYEYEIPLKVSNPTTSANQTDARNVWPDSNEMNITLEELVAAKFKRNQENFPTNTPYVFKSNNRNITIVGNPDLSAVKVSMIGIRNRAINDKYNFKTDDDGLSKCGEVWANELRLEGLNEEGGSAAVTNIGVKLADLGNANISASMHTIGYGQINQRVNERYRDDYIQYNFNTSLQLGKLLPKFIGLQLPFYLQSGKSVSTPQFDPYYNDIKAEQQAEALKAAKGSQAAENYLNTVRTIDDRFGFNFSNVRYLPEKPSTSAFPLAPRFFTASYSFNSVKKSSPFIQSDWVRTYSGELGYTYAAQPVYIEPFKKLIKSKTRAWDWVKSMHINFVPNSVSFTNRLDRTFGVFQQRQLPNESFVMPTQYLKSFTWNRSYGFDYNPIRPMNVNFTAQNMARIDEPSGGLDRKEDVDSIWKNLKRFGRATNYNHALNAKYSLPFSKVPSLSFITSSLNYGTTYTWTTGPQLITSQGELIQSPQGNMISNSQSVGTSVNFKMGKLYSQIPVIKNLDIDNPRNSGSSGLTKEQRDGRKEVTNRERDAKKEQLDKAKIELDNLKQKKKDIKANPKLADSARKIELKATKKLIKAQRKKIREIKKQLSNIVTTPAILRAAAQPLLSVREIDASYNIENSTTIAGFTQNPRYLGIDFNEANHLDPGFAFGAQPGISLFSPPDKYGRWRWLDEFANKGLMTKDTTINLPFTQSNAKVFKARMVVEPIKGFRVNFNWESDYTEKYTEFFAFNPVTQQYEHRNPMESGSYTYSDINLLSSFKKIENSGASQNEAELRRNTQTYANLLNDVNPNGTNNIYVDPLTGAVLPNYYTGYGPLQQDVLINSFLVTYRGQKASGGEKNLSPFSRIPLPNWTINYNGLTQIPAMKKVFSSFTLRHGYNSKTTISNFTSEFRYEGGGGITNPVKIDSISNNFIPYYYIPTMAISESFSPLFGIDFTLKNSMNFKFEYKKSRQVSMSLIDYQLTENISEGFTIGAGYMAKKLKLPFLNAEGKQIVLEDGVRFALDVTYSDNFTVNHKLGQSLHIPVGGAARLTINPKIDATINKKFMVSLFYNYVYNSPRISTSFTTINGVAGAKMSFNLAQ